jgi:Rrf2 family protein
MMVTVTRVVTIKIMANSRFAIAVHTLALMASSKEKPLKSETIACYVRTNPVVIRRILSELGKAELVESQPGASGGSRLRMPPEEISLWKIYKAVETNTAFEVHQPASEGLCKVTSNIQCVLIGIQNRLDKAICQTLRGLTLANVLEMIEEESGESPGAGKCV